MNVVVSTRILMDQITVPPFSSLLIHMTHTSKAIGRMLLLALFVLAGCEGGDDQMEMSEADLVEKARGIHERVITLDTHDDISTSNFTEEQNYTMDLPTQVNLPKMEEGGLDVAWFIVYTGQGPLTDEGYEDAMENAMDKFSAIHWLTEEKAPDQIELALTSDDVRRIHSEGKLVAMIGVENAYPVGLDLGQVAQIWRHGSVVRSWLLDLVADVLRRDPSLEGVAPWVADSGEGRWTVFEAVELDQAAPVITLALLERLRSRDERRFDDRLLAALRRAFGGHATKGSS